MEARPLGNLEISDVGDPEIRWFNEGLEPF